MRRAKRLRCPDTETDAEPSGFKQSNLDNYLLPQKQHISPPKTFLNSLHGKTVEEISLGINEDKATTPIIEAQVLIDRKVELLEECCLMTAQTVQKIFEQLQNISKKLDNPDERRQLTPFLPSLISPGDKQNKYKFIPLNQPKTRGSPPHSVNLILRPCEIVLHIFPYRGPLPYWESSFWARHHLNLLLGLEGGSIDLKAVKRLTNDGYSKKVLLKFGSHRIPTKILRVKAYLAQKGIIPRRHFEDISLRPLIASKRQNKMNKAILPEADICPTPVEEPSRWEKPQPATREITQEKSKLSNQATVASNNSLALDTIDWTVPEEVDLLSNFTKLPDKEQINILSKLTKLQARLTEIHQQGQQNAVETIHNQTLHLPALSPKCIVKKRATNGTFKCIDADLQIQPPLEYEMARKNSSNETTNSWLRYQILALNEIGTPYLSTTKDSNIAEQKMTSNRPDSLSPTSNEAKEMEVETENSPTVHNSLPTTEISQEQGIVKEENQEREEILISRTLKKNLKDPPLPSPPKAATNGCICTRQNPSLDSITELE